jgi:hypothetical protein
MQRAQIEQDIELGYIMPEDLNTVEQETEENIDDNLSEEEFSTLDGEAQEETAEDIANFEDNQVQ